MTVPPGTAELTTARLHVRPWEHDLAAAGRRRRLERDLTALLGVEATRFLPAGFAAARDPAAVSGWVDGLRATARVLTLRDRDTGALVGLIILDTDTDPGAALLGYVLDASRWGAGFATEALAGLVHHLDATLPTRLVAGVDAGNPASARVLEKVGFRPAPGDAGQGVDTYERPAGGWR